MHPMYNLLNAKYALYHVILHVTSCIHTKSQGLMHDAMREGTQSMLYGYMHDLLKNVKHYVNHYTFPRKLGN